VPVVDALMALGKVSRGELITILIIGGPDDGWLAAVAEWL
jgi:hypothetical protein